MNINTIRNEDLRVYELNKAQSLLSWIKENFKTQRYFANAQGIKPSQVTAWLKKDFIVVDGVMYAPRRELKNNMNSCEG